MASGQAHLSLYCNIICGQGQHAVGREDGANSSFHQLVQQTPQVFLRHSLLRMGGGECTDTHLTGCVKLSHNLCATKAGTRVRSERDI